MKLLSGKTPTSKESILLGLNENVGLVILLIAKQHVFVQTYPKSSTYLRSPGLTNAKVLSLPIKKPTTANPRSWMS